MQQIQSGQLLGVASDAVTEPSPGVVDAQVAVETLDVATPADLHLADEL